MKTVVIAIALLVLLAHAGLAAAGPIARVYIAPQDVGVVIGAHQQFSVIGEDADGNEVAVPTPVTWSAAPSVGTITSGGLLTASNTPGRYWNGVTASAPGGLTATANVEVYSNEGSFNNRYVVERSIGSLSAGAIEAPSSMAVDPGGPLYVLNVLCKTVARLAPNGRFLSQISLTDAPSDGDCIAVDSSGSVYVLYKAACKVQKYNVSGSFVTEWGSPGAGNGQFDGPCDIAVDVAGQVYVAEVGNARAQVFTSAGVYSRQISLAFLDYPPMPVMLTVGSNGDLYVYYPDADVVQKFDSSGDPMPLIVVNSWPSGITDFTVDSSGNLYTVEPDAVCKSTPSGAFAKSWDPYGGRRYASSNANSIAVDASNRVYVADVGDSRILAFVADGVLVSSFDMDGDQKGQLKYPSAVTVDSLGNIIVSDSGNRRVQVFDANGGFIREESSFSQKDSRYSCPAGIATSPENTVYVADALGNQVLGYNYSGSLTNTWPLPAPADETGIQASPVGLTYDSRGFLWSVDSYFHKVRKLDMTGSVLTTWGEEGTGNGQFENPVTAGVDSSGNVYVTDYGNNRVQKFSSGGAYSTKWGTSGTGNGQFSGPTGLFVDSSNNIFVVDQGNGRIEKFNTNGTYLTKVGSPGFGKFGFKMPMGIFIDSSDALYVADTYNHRVLKYVPYVAPAITTTIVSPTGGETYNTSSSSVGIAGTCTGTVTSVTWANDRGGSGTCTGATSWNGNSIPLHGGPNVISVAARNSAGLVVTDSLTVIYNEASIPSVAITGPTNGSTYATHLPTITLSGTASDGDTLDRVMWSSDVGGGGVCTGTTSWSTSAIQLSLGVNVFTVTAWDAIGNIATDQVTVTLTDVTSPTIAITSPTSTGSYSASEPTLEIAGTAWDDIGISQVTWRNDTDRIDYSGYCSGTTNWQCSGINAIPILFGQNVITVIAHDAAGNWALATLTVTRTDYTLPTITIASPTSAGGWPVTGSSLHLSGTASDVAGINSVMWTNSRGGSGYCSGYTSWNKTLSMQVGRNDIGIHAEDGVGNWGVQTLIVVYANGGAISSAQAKQLPDGGIVYFSGCWVTAVFADCIYIEDTSRASGIRVKLLAPVPGLTVGSKLDVAGTLGRENGERHVEGVAKMVP